MNLGSRRIRLKAIWLLLIPFVILARPTPRLLAIGGGIALLGTLIRAWAAGCIKKDRELTTRGPYAHTRNPLYLGSLLIGIGVTVAGGRWIFTALFIVFYLLVYRKTMQNEAEWLEEEFGKAYRRYREAVPLLLPRLTPYRKEGAGTKVTAGKQGADASDAPSSGARPGGGFKWFSLRRYLRNREWEAALGVAAGFAFLAIRMVWP